VCTLKLWDPTLGELSGLETVVFAPSSEVLPRVVKPNDIIRVHRAYTGRWGDPPKAQLIVKVGQNATSQTGKQAIYASFLLFAGDGDSEEPYQCSSPVSYTFTDDDRKMFNYMRSIRADAHAAGAGAGEGSGREFLQRISELDPDAHGGEALATTDIQCRVVASFGPGDYPDAKLPAGCRLLYVWDGSDASPLAGGVDLGLERLPPELADRELSGFARQALPLDFLKKASEGELYPLGSLVPVVAFSEVTSRLPSAGSVVVLRRVGVVSVKGQIQLVFLPSSRWGNAPSDALPSLIADFQQRRARNFVAQHAPEDWREIPTAVTAQQMPFSSLRHVLRAAVTGERESRTFRCLVRVVQVTPKVEDFCLPDTPTDSSASRKRKSTSDYVFMLRFELEDATGNLFALLTGDEGTRFFGVEPTNLADEKDSRAASAKAAIENKLSTIRRPRKGGTWIDCLLLQYYPDPPGGRRKVSRSGRKQLAHHMIVKTRVVRSQHLGAGEPTQPRPAVVPTAEALQFV